MAPIETMESLFALPSPTGMFILGLLTTADPGIANFEARPAYNFARAGEGDRDSPLGALEFLFSVC